MIASHSQSLFGDAAWIWPSELGRPVNTYLEFRHVLNIVETPDEHTKLLLAADTAYVVAVNGTFVDRGRFPDVPPERLFDSLEIGHALKRGRNELIIGLYVKGANFSQYLPGDPGLVFAVVGEGISAGSGLRTTWRLPGNYRSGELPRISNQLGFSFEYDASRLNKEPWSKIARGDLGPAASAMKLSARPIPNSDVLPAIKTTVVAQGLLVGTKRVPASPSQAMQQDGMAARGLVELFGDAALPALPSNAGLSLEAGCLEADGFYVVVDLGREETGFVALDIETDVGVVVDIGHGEHLEDLRVRTWVGGRNFASRYTCRDGRQRFVHGYKRMAGRYIQLNVRGVRSRFILRETGLHPALYPIEQRGQFSASDRRLDAIFATSVRTLRLCMHEHYEDCPWREQALYANDARNQALAGYYAFGEGAFPAASLTLLGRGLKPDGWLEMCMPASIQITIPSFTFCWILAVDDHWMYRADRRFAKRMMPIVKAIFAVREKEMARGLLPCTTGQRYWQFYEWVPGLDGRKRLDHGIVRFDALLNLFFVLALRAGARLASVCGLKEDAAHWEKLAKGLCPLIHETFWRPEMGAYVSDVGDQAFDRFYELVQAMALNAGIVPASRTAATLRKKLGGKSDWVETTLSQSLYKYEALLSGSAADQRTAIDSMNTEWDAMLSQGATSFWEMRDGAPAFGGAGSLCHGWSAIPAYLYGAHVLGVRPVEPGFKVFCVDPVASGLDAASGTVATPHGIIEVAWRRTVDGYTGQVRHPASCTCELAPNFRVDGDA